MKYIDSLLFNPGERVEGYSNLYLRLGRTKKALNIFEEVLKSHPKHFDALYGLAMAHTKLDNRSQAIAAWKRYIAEAPRSGWKGRAKEHLQQLLEE